MKKFLLQLAVLILFLFLGLTVISAKVFVVDNNTNSGAKYTTAQAAVDAAAAGDTIIIIKSTFNYGYVTLNKKLNIFGEGYFHNKSLASSLGSIMFDDGSDYSVLKSVKLTGGATNSILIGNPGADNITIESCFFHIDSYNSNAIGVDINGLNNWKIIGNIFSNYIFITIFANNSNSNTNILISNNLMQVGRIYYLNKTCTIRNNIIGGVISTTECPIYNNIFYNTNATELSIIDELCTNSVFYKNITYSPNLNNLGLSLPLLPTGNNAASDNLQNTDPLFQSTLLNNINAYKLENNSPGKNFGTDGTDVGIYGGNYNFSLDGAFPLPQVTSVKVKNLFVPLNGTIEVEVKANTQK